MSIGKVTVWKMTEEQRLDYIKKNPIVPTKKPTGVSNAEIKQVAAKKKSIYKGPSIIDSVDKDELHRLYTEGKTFEEMASILNVKVGVLNTYIKAERNSGSDKYPHRAVRKGSW